MAFVASAGDSGAPASWPSASPNVLSVGGTALTLAAGNVWSSEVGWSGSGGGPSAYESQPSYQNGVVTQTSTARATPDVAYDASPSTGVAVYDSVPYDGTTYDWIEVGGTSAGAPQWSALLAIADQGRALASEPALDSTSPQEVMNILYENPTDFHDITSGTSTGNPQYSAGPGYDYVTGLGSPIANLIVGSLDATSTSSHDTLVLAAPTAETAGTSFNLTVTAENSSGATDTDYLGTIQFTSSDVQAGLPANFTFTAADDGTYTFTVTLKTAGSQSITATDTTTSAITGTLSGISVSPATASQFVLSGLPATSTAGVSQTVTVTAEDPYGNVATGYLGTVQFTSSDPQATLPANYSFTAGDQGVHVFSLTFETAGTQSVTVTDTGSGITGTESGITVQAAAAESFMVTGFPVADMAGAANHVTVTAYDAYGNVATGYTGTISLASSDPRAILVPSSYTFGAADAGTHTFSVTLETAGTQTITATDTVTASLTATESNIAVKPAAASILKVTAFPTSDMAGAANHVTVTAYDAYGNVATEYTGTVSLTSSDPHAVLVPSSYSFVAADAGAHTFSVTLETAGTQTITATDTVTASLTATESNIAVKPAAASILKVTAFPTSDMAGAAGDVVVTAYDAYGNVATAYTGTVSLTSSDPHAVLPSSFTFPGTTGTFTFAVTLDTAGAQSITATDTVTPTITGTESGITVAAAAAKTLTIGGFPTSDTAGAAGNVVVTAYDAYGNVATGYTGTVSLTSSDPRAILVPSSYTFGAADAGKHTLSVTLETAGTQTITATDTMTASLTATESHIAVKPAAASILKVTAFPTSDMAGAAGDVVVTAYDAYGNVATGYTGTISFSSGDPQALLPSGFSFTAADAGAHTYSVTLETVGTQSITATDTANATIAGTESGITVRAMPRVTWSSPASIVYGTPLGDAQLDAVANVPGTFTYTPAMGAILDAGSGQTLSVAFRPEDATDYTTAATTTVIDVTKAAPILKVTDDGGRFDGSAFPASATIKGAVAGVDRTPASSLDDVTPTLTYHDGSGTAGASLGATPPSAPGTYTVVAAFAGAADYAAVTSTPLTFTIGQGAATIALVSSAGSAVSGQLVSFIATVSTFAGTPAGTVSFSDGATWLATFPLDGSGAATFSTRALSVGSRSITATYSGDAEFLGVESAPYSESVAQAGTEVDLVENSVFKKNKLMSVRLTAQIMPLSPGGRVPTGDVTFELVTKAKKHVRVNTLAKTALIGGKATSTLMANQVLQKAITIVYSGDANDEASTLTTVEGGSRSTSVR